MKKLFPPLILALLMLLGAVALAQQPKNSAAEAKIAPHLLNAFEKDDQSEFFIILTDKADLSRAARYSSKAQKGRYVYNSLWQTAQRSQAPLKTWLDKRGITYRSFYIVNALLIKGDYNLALTLAKRADVLRLEANPVIHNSLPSPLLRVEAPRSANAIEPNITYINADDVWDMGFTGQGIVVGGQDTGYDWDHPALLNQYRGWNGAAANHDYNWHDSIHSGGGVCGADSPEPCDDHGHGTHTMGTAVGDDGGSNQIGVAPGAKWIGCRNMDVGDGTPATYLECFEFFLAPYPVGGTPAQGDPTLAPDVTVNSWGCPPSEGCSWDTLQNAVEAQVAAGIMTVVSAGNSGSSCSSVEDPAAIYNASYTVGAIDHRNGSLAYFSSRGPVTVDNSNRRKPDISAPGVSIRSAAAGGGYVGGWSGTSMAGPHVSGAVALLWSVAPALTNNITATENYFNNSAVHVSSTQCSSSGVPNNLYGYGRLDVLAAVKMALRPTADFTFTVPANLTRTVTFTNLSTGNAPFTSTWDFGDGTPPQSTGTLLLPTQHTYAAGGSYTVTLDAANQYGTSVVQHRLTLPMPPAARFTHTMPLLVNAPVTFTNLTTGTQPVTSTWNFGDGSASQTNYTLAPVQHTYTQTGSYTVTLRAVNQYGNSTARRQVTVYITPVARFTHTTPTLPNQPITFTNLTTGTQPITSTWNFGDGSAPYTDTALLPVQHTYATGGNYTVTLSAANRYGVSKISRQLELPLAPVAAFTHSAPVLVNRPVTFTNLTTGTQPITFTWNFGDGSQPDSGTLMLPVMHTYAAVGTYSVILTANNKIGSDVFSDTVTVSSALQVYLPIVLKP